eukprot:IDg20711t1
MNLRSWCKDMQSVPRVLQYRYPSAYAARRAAPTRSAPIAADLSCASKSGDGSIDFRGRSGFRLALHQSRLLK